MVLVTGQVKAEMGEWVDVGGGDQARRLRGQDEGAMEEGIMRLQDQRVQLKIGRAHV